MNPLRSSRWFFLGLMVAFSLVSCANSAKREEAPSTLYDEYDQTVLDLKARVDRGELSVVEAENLRQRAFRDYLTELKSVRIAREARNW